MDDVIYDIKGMRRDSKVYLLLLPTKDGERLIVHIRDGFGSEFAFEVKEAAPWETIPVQIGA